MEMVINGLKASPLLACLCHQLLRKKDVKGDEKTWMDRASVQCSGSSRYTTGLCNIMTTSHIQGPHIRFIGETGLEDPKWCRPGQNQSEGKFPPRGPIGTTISRTMLWATSCGPVTYPRFIREFVSSWPSMAQARTQLAWHKKLPFDGEHLKLMGQASDVGCQIRFQNKTCAVHSQWRPSHGNYDAIDYECVQRELSASSSTTCGRLSAGKIWMEAACRGCSEGRC